MKTCKDIAPNFGKNRPSCFIITMPHLTLPSSPTSFWRKTKLLLSPTHRTPLIWHPVNSLFPKLKLNLKGRRFETTEDIQAESQKRTTRKHSKNGGDDRTSVYMWEGTTSRVTAADRPYGEI